MLRSILLKLSESPGFAHWVVSNNSTRKMSRRFVAGETLDDAIGAARKCNDLGMMASLLFGTVFASASHLSLAYLAAHGDHGGGEFWLFALTVSIDNFAYAFASIVLITYMSSLTTTDHAASQYALLTSICAMPGSLLAGGSGFIIERVGFEWFFVATSMIGAPVAILCWYVWHLQERTKLQPAT